MTLSAPLCKIDDIPDDQARGFKYKNLEYIAVKFDGNISVYINRCPHLGVPLNWEPDDFMDADGDLLRCSTHGALFLIDSGECVSGPCTGQSLQAAPFQIKNNKIYLLIP